MTEAPDWYTAQEDDAAFLGEATAESKWHGISKPAPYRQALRECSASFDEIARQVTAQKEAAE